MAAEMGLERAMLLPAPPPRLASGADLGWAQEGHDEGQADSRVEAEGLPWPQKPLQELSEWEQGP